MVKAAVIGAGVMGRNHIRIYADMPHVSLVAVADADADSAHRAVRSYRTRPYTDYRRMLDEEQPDLVSISVPTEHHASVAHEAIERGIHVLIEKPLALSHREGRALLDAAARRGVKVMVGHVERFNPAVVEVKRLLERQELGRVFQVHARRLSPFPERIRDVGVILDLATHDIDVMRFLIGSHVRRVYAEIEQKAHEQCEDVLSGSLRFENGVIGVLDVNWLTPTKVRQVSVLGEGGMYLVDYLTQDVYWYKNREVSGNGWDTETLRVYLGAHEGDVVKLHLRKQEPLRAEIESFVRAVTDDLPVIVSGEDGLVALDLAQKLIESGRRHEVITIDSEAQLALAGELVEPGFWRWRP